MDRNSILEFIGEEISRLERAKELLTARNGYGKLEVRKGKVATGGTTEPKKRFLSEDARNRIAQAQKRRWAKQRREALVAKKAS